MEEIEIEDSSLRPDSKGHQLIVTNLQTEEQALTPLQTSHDEPSKRLSLVKIFRESTWYRGSKKLKDVEEQALTSFINFDDIPSMSDSEVRQFRDDRGYSILMLASEAGRLDVVQNLIDRCEEVNFDVEGESAVSLAYKEDHDEVVLALLQANSKYPPNFDHEATLSDALRRFVTASSLMHVRVKEVKEKNVERVKNYLRQEIEANPSVRYFYDPTENISLLKRAILHRKFSLYEFLLSLNIFLGNDESMDEINEQLTDDERETLSDINFRISPNLMTEPMMILMRNCKLSPDSPKERQGEFMGFIREAFDSLFMIPLIAIVLKIVAASRNFKIVFDFKRDSVTFLDPTSEPYCNGLMYFCGKIFIGAKDLLSRETAHLVTSVIAHELTHYAMFLVYGNMAKPYKDFEFQRRDLFEEIAVECRRFQATEEIVELVFSCYERSMRHAELIVRVPHMIAMYLSNVEVLSERRETFSRLFDFYEQTCVPEMEAELPRIEEKFCPVKQVEKKVKKQKRWIFFLVIFIVIGSIFSGLGLYRFYNPTISWSDLTENEQNFIKNSTVEIYGVEVKLGELFANDSKVFDLLSSEQLKSGLDGNSEELSRALNQTLKPYVFLTWSNMTQRLKESFLTREVDFQGQKVSIGKFTRNLSTFNLLSSDQIREIFTENSFKISSKVERKVKIYIERYFFHESIAIGSEQFIGKGAVCRNRKRLISCPEIYKNGKIVLENSDVISFSNITESIQTSKIFLLSSAAGDGKSTTFRHFSHKLKEKFPQKWIQFVDLKKHFEAFKTGETMKLNDPKILSQFLGEKVLALEGFELETFKELFVAGDVIFLWDGVDEISPNFKNFMLNLVANVLKPRNFQFISTRPQHSKDFQNTFKVETHKSLTLQIWPISYKVRAKEFNETYKSSKALKLIPFSELDRFEFLVKTIADKKFNEDGTEVLEKLKSFYNQSFEDMKETLKETQFSKYCETISKAKKIFKNIDQEKGSDKDEYGRLVDRFVSNPLMISMISEISCDEDFQVKNSSFNSYQLYQTFIDKKLEVVDEKGKIAQKEKNRRSRKIDIWQVHQILALKLIFERKVRYWSEEYVDTFKFDFLKVKLEEVLNQFSAEQISRFGILQVNSIRKNEDGDVVCDFDFAHRTFAEFFVAEFFLDFLSQNEIDLNIKENHWKFLLLAENFVERLQEYPIVKSLMFDGSKLDNFESKFFEFWADVESKKLLIDEKFRKILEASQFLEYFNMQKPAVFNSLSATYCPEFCLNEKKSFNLTQIEETLGGDFVRTLLNFKGLGFFNSLLVCSVRSKNYPEIFSQLLSGSRRFLNETEIIASLIEPQYGYNVFFRSIDNGMNFTKIFIDFIENSLSKDSQKKVLISKIDKSLTALQYSALRRDQSESFDYLKKIYEKIFTKEEIREQFLSSDFITKWFRNENEKNFEYLRELFETDDLTNVGFKGNEKDLRDFALKNFDSIKRFWNDAEKVLNDEKLKKILSFNDENFWTLLQESVYSNDFSTFEFLKEIYEKFFTKEEIKKSFLVKKIPYIKTRWRWIEDQSNEVLSFFDFAFRERLDQYFGTEETIKPLIAYLQELFETKDLRKIGFTINDNFFLKILNERTNDDDVNFVWNLISEFLSEQELKKLLLYKTEDGQTALKVSFEKNVQKIFESVKKIYEQFFTRDEIKEFL